ncbi:glycosyltransferase family 2 protein [Aquimarina rhabdastrellae]
MSSSSPHPLSLEPTPLFSIIIPLYNKASYIKNTLDSVLAQTVSDYEIIIIDDGSTDQSATIAKAVSDTRITYTYQENQGVSAARNHGIQLARGTYITFIDADDYWYPFFLEEILNSIQKFPEASVFSMAIERKFKQHTYPEVYAVPHINPVCIDYFEGSQSMSLLTTSSTVIKATVFEHIGYFDTQLKATEDIDLWIRIGLHYLVVFNSRIGVRYIDVPKSLSNLRLSTTYKSSYDAFSTYEAKRPYLKRFLDQNRFALALESKLTNNNERYSFYKKSLSIQSLNWKQKLILKCPAFFLKILLSLKQWLASKGLRTYIFKG